jgi:hypothetical protein
MMESALAKKIISVGFSLASDDVAYEDIESKVSLLDWDIVLFQPDVADALSRYHDDYYQGKPSLTTTGSFRLREATEHWRREIKQAVDAGKMVVVFLSESIGFYADTGAKQYSGTGKNTRTTRMVSACSNYQMIPGMTAPLVARGNSMKLASKGAEILSSYWDEFSGASTFEVLLPDLEVPPLITTKNGDRAVGALLRSKTSQGSLLLLPNIEFNPDEFFDEAKDFEYTENAYHFAARLIAAMVSLDKSLRSEMGATPPPAWAEHPSFELTGEKNLKAALLEAEKAVEEAQRRKENIECSLIEAGVSRALLFEKGRPLEAAIIGALKCLGFSASNFKLTDSEFDVVFESAEGRLIGEAEGKDNKAVNIEKLRQLAMNIQEDFQREEVQKLAKPVLFGNAFRLAPLPERGDPFTDKCCTAAEMSQTALVFTPDLFFAMQYVLESKDLSYAKACREALVNTAGRVAFPIPKGLEDVPRLEGKATGAASKPSKRSNQT